jgi:predicted aspartyl protease/cytochrome c-type biogenesis protein CcmH/NrfG
MRYIGTERVDIGATRRLRRIVMIVAIVSMFASTSAAALPVPTPDPDDPKKLAREAGKHIRNGKLDEAESLLRRAVAVAPDRVDTKIELARLLVRKREVVEPYELLMPIVKADQKNSRALSVLALALITAGRFGDARRLVFAALRANRKEHLAWYGFGLVEFYENRIDEALLNLREATFYAPTEPDYLFTYAQVAARAEDYSEAAEAYEMFLRFADIYDRDRRERIKGLIAFLRYLGTGRDLYTSAAKDGTTVPFQLIGNRPIITVRVNGGRDPLRFVLDTGSGMSVLSTATAKRLGIRPVARGGYARGIGGSGKFEIVYGLLKDLSVGDVTLKQVPVYIRPFHTQAAEVDGYIGLGLVSKFLTTVDYGSRTFSLRKRAPHDASAGSTEDELALPLRLTSSGFLSGEVQVAGLDTPLNFIVDTGASVSVISHDLARTDAISPFARSEKLQVIGSAGVTEGVTAFQIPKISFGTYSRTDVTAIALDLDIINETAGFEQNGILGGNFLKNFSLTFDFKNSRVVFKPITTSSPQ